MLITDVIQIIQINLLSKKFWHTKPLYKDICVKNVQSTKLFKMKNIVS